MPTWIVHLGAGWKRFSTERHDMDLIGTVQHGPQIGALGRLSTATTRAERASEALDTANAGFKKAQAALAAANTPEAKAAAKALVAERAEAVRLAGVTKDEADKASEAAAKKLKEPKAAWEKQNSANEPEKVKAYRARLMKCRCVSQVFDPWFMDDAAQDRVAPTPNHLKDGNEFAHRHHLHITVSEPKIL